jgi:S1-C subfamily serine protease
MADIVNYSILLIQNMREFQELSYVKLDIADNKKRTKDYKVTLGIMPDYAGGGKGLKVMSVSPDKPADKAGIIDGDIIIQMGDVKIGDIYDYMESLAKFNKGDKIKVVIMRQGKKLSKDVEF